MKSVLKDKSSIEVWSGKKPSVSHLRVFGCECMVHVPYDAKLRFIGYCDATKGYRVIDPKTRKVYTSRDVILYENQYIIQPDGENISFEIGAGTSNEASSVKDSGDAETTNEASDSDSNETFVEADNSTMDPSYMPSVNIENIVSSPVRRSERIRNVIPNPLSLIAEECNSDPLIVREALDSVNSNEWKKAMQSEYESLLKNETWTLVSLPENRKTLNNKRVL